MSIPKVTTKSKYELSWKLGLINMEGSGDGFADLGNKTVNIFGCLVNLILFIIEENLKVLLKITGSRYLKNDIEFMKIDAVKLNIKPGSMKVRYENLFKGNKALENVGNEFINQNIDLIANDIIPKVENGIERKILAVANQVFEKAPADEFFP